MKQLIFVTTLVFLILNSVNAKTIRLAAFNVSMEADNYIPEGASPTGEELFRELATGENSQIKNIAEIIQRVRPDVILLNEFDYTDDETRGIKMFLTRYLNVSQQGQSPIDYPHYFVAPVNTGVGSGLDLNRDGRNTEAEGDAWGYGKYPGQYAMALLSRYPIDKEHIRTFQRFLWKDLPQNTMASIKLESGETWYSAEATKVMRLSSKSHWDVPLVIDGQRFNILASHPTPPVFDGPENRNGYRNHDELMFWSLYLSGSKAIYDDLGTFGGFEGKGFAIMGDLNASVEKGDAIVAGIKSLVEHSLVFQMPAPSSEGAKQHTPDEPGSESHTAGWRMRADYVLVSKQGLEVKDSGVFWPVNEDPLARLVKDRASSSDHRLVWVDITLTETTD